MPTLSSLADRVRWALDQAEKLTAAELSKLAGLAPQVVWHWIHGKVAEPRRETLVAVARVLGAGVDWLATGRGRAPSRRRIAEAVRQARASARSEGGLAA